MVTELFHAKSARWGDIAENHVQDVAELVSRFVRSVLAFVIRDMKTLANIQRSVKAKLEKNMENGFEELGKLLQDEAGYPITYNHYYTDNIQKARSDHLTRYLRKSLDNTVTSDGRDRRGRYYVDTEDQVDRLMAHLNDHTITDMEERACSEAQIDLDAYYKVWMPLGLNVFFFFFLALTTYHAAGCNEDVRRQCVSSSH